MSPRTVSNFLRSKFGLFIVFVVVLFAGLWIYGSHQDSRAEAQRTAAAKGKKIELGQVHIPLNQGLEDGLPQQTKQSDSIAAQPSPSTKSKAVDGIVPFRPTPLVVPMRATSVVVEKTPPPKPMPAPKKVHYASLLASYEPPPPAPKEEPKPPERFIPYGTLLKCKLVNTVDSSNMGTPVIAVLLEDVWQNGKLVVPANTLVHGRASAGRIRDRVTAMGAWRFVWQDGRELSFTGVALDREYDQNIDGYGITDGSAGLRGRVLAADNLQELKMMAAAALSGFARGTQDRTQTAIGTTIVGSLRNGAMEGVGEVFDMYAKRVLDNIEENGYFVRVAAGKEFYVYVLDTINPAKAKIAGAVASPPVVEENNTADAPPQGKSKG